MSNQLTTNSIINR